jgi:hypothetical protein
MGKRIGKSSKKLFEKPRRGDNIIAWGDAPGLEA